MVDAYIWTREGWLYLAIVLDLYSRRIVGWETRDRLKKGLAITALKRAIATRYPPIRYCLIQGNRLNIIA